MYNSDEYYRTEVPIEFVCVSRISGNVKSKNYQLQSFIKLFLFAQNNGIKRKKK